MWSARCNGVFPVSGFTGKIIMFVKGKAGDHEKRSGLDSVLILQMTLFLISINDISKISEIEARRDVVTVTNMQSNMCLCVNYIYQIIGAHHLKVDSSIKCCNLPLHLTSILIIKACRLQ